MLRFKIIEAPKKFKNQPRPIVRSSSVNFCQNFRHLSHETVPLNLKIVEENAEIVVNSATTLPPTTSTTLSGNYSIFRLKITIVIVVFFLLRFPGVMTEKYCKNCVRKNSDGNPAWPLSATRRTPAVRDSKKDSLSSAMRVRWSLLALSMLSRFTRGFMVEPFRCLHSN